MAYCLNPSCPQPQNRADANFCLSCGAPLMLGGKYRPESLLGKGGFGRTLLASVIADEDSSNRCVIKQIYALPSADRAAFQSSFQSSFQSEAKRLEQLGKHPQIPRLLDSVENDLGQFLVQEFAPGENLEDWIEKEGARSEEEVRSLLSSLASVLQYVHSFKVIHRDIKPANIVRGSGINRDSLMLVDFGAAKWIGKTAAKTVIGSAGYAAPEQSMGQATFASDIYSLGLTGLHLLTELHPFELYSAVEDRWVWQDYLPAPVSAGFAQVLDKMVARPLQERYATMDDVAAALKATERFSLGSASPTLAGAKQLLAKAKGSVLPLQGAIKGNHLGNHLAETLQKMSRGASPKPLAPVVFDSQPWRLSCRISEPMGLTTAISVSSTASMFATAGSDKAIRLWDLADGALLHTFSGKRFGGNRFGGNRFGGEGHGAAVVDVQFHPDGRALYSASEDGTIKEWDAWEHALMNTLPSTGWTPTALAVSSDGKTLVNANSDGRIALWDIATLAVRGQLAQHQNRVNAIALSQSGDLLASAGEDNTVRLWQSAAGQVPQLAKVLRFESSTLQDFGRQTFGSFANGRKGVVAVALQRLQTIEEASHKASYLVVATGDTVRRYEIASGSEVSDETVLCHLDNAIGAISLSQSGLLAVGTEDRVLRLWRVLTGECVAELKHDWGIRAIAFSADGRKLVTASADETLSIWQL